MHPDLKAAYALHQQGNLQEAERAYRDILKKNPRRPGALYLMGALALQVGKPDSAVELTTRAIRLADNVAAYHFALGNAHLALDQREEALSAYRRTLELQPDHVDALNNLALMYQRDGNPEGAEQHYRKALEINEDYVNAWVGLAALQRASGKVDESIASNQEALKRNPEFAEAHSNLCSLLGETGKLEEAIRHGREAIRIRPRFANARNNLALALMAGDEIDEAIRLYYDAIRLEPENAMFHNNVALLLQEVGRFDGALIQYQVAIQRDPKNAMFHINVARLLRQLRRIQESLTHAGMAVELQPELPEAHVALGQSQQAVYQYEAAIASFRKALELAPQSADAWTRLGVALAETGALEESMAAYREALKHDAEHIEAYSSLTTHHVDATTDDDKKAMLALLERPHLKPGARSALHYSLGTVSDHSEELEQAAHHWKQANEVHVALRMRRGLVYDPVHHAGKIDSVIKDFGPEFFRRLESKRPPTEATQSALPVFVVGMPRSGTTLTEQILAAHPDVYPAGEPRLVQQSFEQATQNLPEGESWCDVLLREPTRIAAAAEALLDRYQSIAGGAARVVDKLPENYTYLGWIWTLFPNARVIHCIRDARAIAFSCYKTSFNEVRWANVADDIALRIRDYLRLMQHWRAIGGQRLLEARYAQTVTHLEPSARQMIQHIGLEWNDACLHPENVKREVATASVVQVRQPVHAQSVERWKAYESVLPELFAPYAKKDSS